MHSTPIKLVEESDIQKHIKEDSIEFLQHWNGWQYGLSPKTTAASVVYYVNLMHNRPYIQEDIAKEFNTSVVSIRKIRKRFMEEFAEYFGEDTVDKNMNKNYRRRNYTVDTTDGKVGEQVVKCIDTDSAFPEQTYLDIPQSVVEKGLGLNPSNPIYFHFEDGNIVASDTKRKDSFIMETTVHSVGTASVPKKAFKKLDLDVGDKVEYIGDGNRNLHICKIEE